MGNAHSKNSAVQQPPPICKKPPAQLPTPTPEERFLILQAFVNVTVPLTPGAFYLQAIVDLPPIPAIDTWLGNTTFPSWNAEVEIIKDPLTNLYSIEITAVVNGSPINAVLWTGIERQTVNPFKLPMLTEDLPLVSEFWQINVYT